MNSIDKLIIKTEIVIPKKLNDKEEPKKFSKKI